MKSQICCIKGREVAVIFGGNIGFINKTRVLTDNLDNTSDTYSGVAMQQLEGDHKTGDYIGDNWENEKSPQVALYFNNEKSIDLLIEALERAKSRLKNLD